MGLTYLLDVTHNITCCTLLFIIASVDITPKGNNTGIECPGDILSYTCSIKSNNNYIHLIWRVTFPDNTTISIIFDEDSEINITGNFISTRLEFSNNSYIESTLEFTIQDNDIFLYNNKMVLIWCGIGDIENDSVTAVVNYPSRKLCHAYEIKCCNCIIIYSSSSI